MLHVSHTNTDCTATCQAPFLYIKSTLLLKHSLQLRNYKMHSNNITNCVTSNAKGILR